jgi:RNA polymerase sigma-70 factor (ECF subfamily)
LVEALRRGDERAFGEVVDRHGAAMFRLARAYERDMAVSQEIVQDAWLAVLRGIERFEGRSSLQTWLLRIVANIARTRAVREARSVPFSALLSDSADKSGRSVSPDRFLGPASRWAGHWSSPPDEWNRPERELLSRETRGQIADAIERLPMGQRLVITLRDVEGWSAAEVCTLLDVTESNQRVLLHRARSRVRHALAHYLTGEANESVSDDGR